MNFNKIILNENENTVFLQENGMKVDLGGIAKGYAIDRGVQALRQHGMTQFLLNAGGDVFASGAKRHEKKWKIGVKHPRNTNDLFAVFEISDFAVATSGDYERFVEIDGTRFHHILDPKTGFPATVCQSVTALAKSAEAADVLATYLFIAGAAKIPENENSGLLYMLIDSSGNVHYNQVGLMQYNLQFTGNFATQQTN